MVIGNNRSFSFPRPDVSFLDEMTRVVPLGVNLATPVQALARTHSLARSAVAACTDVSNAVMAPVARADATARAALAHTLGSMPPVYVLGQRVPGIGRAAPRPVLTAPSGASRPVLTARTGARGPLNSHPINLDDDDASSPRIQKKLDAPSPVDLGAMISMLREGTFELWAQVDDQGGALTIPFTKNGHEQPLAFRVAPNTILHIRQEMSTLRAPKAGTEEPAGPLMIKGVLMELSKPLVLKNPGAMAGLGNDHPLTQLADFTLDMQLDGFRVEADGRMIPLLKLSPVVPGPIQELHRAVLGHDLEIAIPLPTLDDGKRMEMRADLAFAPKPKREEANESPLDLFGLLHDLGIMLKFGFFNIKGRGATGVVDIKDKVDLRGAGTRFDAAIEGRFAGSRSGALAARVNGKLESDLVDAQFQGTAGLRLARDRVQGYVRTEAKTSASERLPKVGGEPSARLPIEIVEQGPPPAPIGNNGLGPKPRDGALSIGLAGSALAQVDYVSKTILGVPQGNRLHYETHPESNTRVDVEFAAKKGQAPVLEKGYVRTEMSLAGATLTGRDQHVHLGSGSRVVFEVEDLRIAEERLTAERAGGKLDLRFAEPSRVRKLGVPAEVQMRDHPHLTADLDVTTDDRGEIAVHADVRVAMTAKPKLGPVVLPLGYKIDRVGEVDVDSAGTRAQLTYKPWYDVL